MTNEIQIGDNVLYNSKLEGIVRFIGSTASAKGTFYGIELHSSNGRTDGTMDGISYFKCKDKHGIFARRSQLSKIIKFTELYPASNLTKEMLLSNYDENKDAPAPNLIQVSGEIDSRCKNNEIVTTNYSAIIPVNQTNLEINSDLRSEKDFRRNTISSNLKSIEGHTQSSFDNICQESIMKGISKQESILELKKEITKEDANKIDNNSSSKPHRNSIAFQLKPQENVKQTQIEIENMHRNVKVPTNYRRNTVGNKEIEKENKFHHNFGIKDPTNQHMLTIFEKDPNDKQLNNNSCLPRSLIATQETANQMDYGNQQTKISSLKYPRRNTLASKPVSCDNRQGKENQLIHARHVGASTTNTVTNLDKDKEIKDLKEKYETLQILKKKEYKRCADLERLNKELQKELLDVKEREESIKNEFNSYRDMMKSGEEEIEMITIDKEMAEEKLEQTSQDYQKLKELYEQVLEENAILRNSEGTSDAKSFIDQTATINKYKNALVELSHSINCFKEENQNLNSELDIVKELQIFQENESEQLKTKLEKSEKDLKEMKDLVDSTADVEVILDKLTFKNEYLEKELKKLNKRLTELDQLEDDRLEVIESKDRKIREFHEECDCLNQLVNEMQNLLDKKRIENNELIKTTNQMNEKISSLTNEVKEKELEIHRQNEIVKKAKEKDRELSNLTFSKQNLEKNEMNRDIETKLKTIELNHKSRQIEILIQYLPASFSLPGGELDLIETVQIVDKLIDKISLVLEYIIQKRRFHQQSDNSENNPENICIQYKLEFLLLIWCGLLKQLQINIHHSSPEALGQLRSEYKQILEQEQTIDLLIDLMKKQCLDNSRNLSSVLQSIMFFQNFHTDRFYSQQIDCNLKMKNFISILSKGSECLRNDLSWIDQMLENNGGTKTKILIDNLNKISSNVQSTMKNTQIFLRHDQRIIFDSVVSKSLDDITFSLMDVVLSISDFALQLTDERIFSDESMCRLMEIFSKHRNPLNPTSDNEILFALNSIDKLVENIVSNFKSGVYDADKLYETLNSAIDTNAANYREKLMRLQALSFEIKLKDEMLALINQELKEKSSHLSDMLMQVNFFKQKLFTAVESREVLISQLNDKISELEVNAKRNDIVKLSEFETEKLKNSYELISNSPVSHEQSFESCSIDINDYQNEIRNLKIAVKYLMNELHRSNAKQSNNDLKELKPIKAQNFVSNNYSVNMLMRQAITLRKDIYEGLSTVKVPDLSSRKDIKQFFEKSIQFSELKNQSEKLIIDGMRTCHRKSVFLNSSNADSRDNSIGLIRFNRNSTNDQSIKCALIDNCSLKKLEDLFC